MGTPPATGSTAFRPNRGPTLHRQWAVPAGQPWARVALLPGYGDHAGRHAHVLTALADHGVAAHAMDFRGHGRSAGRVGYVRRWAEYLDDLTAFLAVEELAANDGVPLFVLAHSHGGLVAVTAAAGGLLDRCRGVVLSAPYLSLAMPVAAHRRAMAVVLNRVVPWLPLRTGIGGALLTHDAAMAAADAADPLRAGVATPRWFVVARRAQAVARASAAAFRLPLLLLLAGDDAVADSAASAAWFEHVASADKTVRTYAGHRHELLREAGRAAVLADVLAWMRERAGPV